MPDERGKTTPLCVGDMSTAAITIYKHSVVLGGLVVEMLIQSLICEVMMLMVTGGHPA